MSDKWYAVRNPEEVLTQGDIILECPVLTWGTGTSHTKNGTTPEDSVERLGKLVACVKSDVVVMTQACDLAQGKVSNIVLCPCTPLSKYKELWEANQRKMNQTPTEKSWIRLCDDIKDGFMWNLFMMDALLQGELTTEHRIVDFHTIFTVPKIFLEYLLAERGHNRLSLLPPYREHLSQSFARYFMRVGLPQNINPEWRPTKK